MDRKGQLFQGFVRGMLPLYVLMLVEQRAYHGTEIIEAFSAMSGHQWKPSPGSVYPVLRRLEKEGLVRGRWQRTAAAPKRVYRLTKKGAEQLPSLQRQLLAELRAARQVLDEHIGALTHVVTGSGEGHGH